MSNIWQEHCIGAMEKTTKGETMSITSWLKERQTIVPKEDQVGKYEFRAGFYKYDITQIMEEFSRLGKDIETIINGIKVMNENTKIINRQIDSRVELIRDQNHNLRDQIVVLNSLLESEQKARTIFEERLEKRMTEFHKQWLVGMKTIVGNLKFLRSGSTGVNTQEDNAGRAGGTSRDGKAARVVGEAGDETAPSLVGASEDSAHLVLSPGVAEIEGLPDGLTDDEIDQVLRELPGDHQTKESATAEGMDSQAEETLIAEEKAKETPEPRAKKIFTWEHTAITRQEMVLLTTKAGRLLEKGSGRESLEQMLETLIQRETESGVKWVADSLRESLKALRKKHLEKVTEPLGKIIEKLDGVKNGASGTIPVEADEIVTNEAAQMDGEDFRIHI
jgi:hypothetical protein